MFIDVTKNILGKRNLSRLKYLYFFLKPRINTFIIEIVASCNAKCPFCTRSVVGGNIQGIMDIELFKSILDEIEESGYKNANIRLYSRGEPLLHPKLDEIIFLLIKKNLYIDISTNAYLLDRYQDALLSVDSLQFSVEGWDKESYEFYRYPLKFEKVFANIKNFHELKKNKSKKTPITYIHLLLNKYTNIEKFVDLWGPYVDYIVVDFMYENAVFNASDQTFVSVKSDPVKNQYFKFRRNYNKICNYPFDAIVILSNGKIAICCADFQGELELGHIKDGIPSLLKNSVRKKIQKEFLKNDPITCKGCYFFSEVVEDEIDRIKIEFNKLNRFKEKIILRW